MIFKKAFIALDSNRVMLVQSFIEITLLKVSFLLWLVIQEFRFFFSYIRTQRLRELPNSRIYLYSDFRYHYVWFTLYMYLWRT